MEKIALSALTALGVMGLLVLVCVAGLLAGAFAGAVAGYFFPGTLGLISALLFNGAHVPAWQVGAALGFIGGFFKARLTAQTDD